VIRVSEVSAMVYGETAKPWPQTVTFFDELAADNEAFRPLAVLAHQIVRSPFPAAGLHGLTSMHDILLGPSPAVIDNPFLRIAYDFTQRHFVLTYAPGGEGMAAREPQWNRIAKADDAWPAIEEFLTRRARWYRPSERAMRGPTTA
jgi:hypothetical protein